MSQGGASIAQPQPQPESPQPAATDLTAGVEEPEQETGDAGVETPPPLGPADAAEPIPVEPDRRLAWLGARAAAILAARPTQLGAARVGVAIVDATTGKPLFVHDGDGRYSLASVTKVLTTGAALARLGADFRWRTAVYADRFDPATGRIDGDLYVRGRGDPTLTSADLRALAADVRRAGVRDVKGGLVFDGSYFDAVTEPPHFAEQPKERAGFRAPIGAFAIEGNSFAVAVTPDPTGRGAAAVTLEPPAGTYVAIRRAEVVTSLTGRTRIRVDVKVEKDAITVAVAGQIRLDEGVWRTRRRIDDPVRFAGEALRAFLAGQGVRVALAPIRTGAVPRTARVLAVHDSPALGDVLRDMDKSSNNFVAETVLKTLGAESRAAAAPATWDDGLAAVRRWLVEEVGLSDGSFRVGNGSGLFGSTDFTPAQIAQVMLAAYRDFRLGPDFVGALPVGGVDGTLRRRFTAPSARGRVRAKTGTLASTATLAGYVAVDGRRPLAFAILVNDIPDNQRAHARAVQDALIEACIAYLDTP